MRPHDHDFLARRAYYRDAYAQNVAACKRDGVMPVDYVTWLEQTLELTATLLEMSWADPANSRALAASAPVPIRPFDDEVRS